VNRQISRIALFSLMLLASLIVATTYWQTWASAGLADRQDNAIERVAQFEIKRGRIFTADGVAVATNVKVKRGDKTLYFRRYPTRGLAAQVVGYSTQARSRAGLEREENAYLTASNANIGTVVDKLTNRLTGGTIVGNDVILTINSKLQRLAETQLRGKCGSAVLLNPKTGAVLAMASSPTYDPNLIETPNGYRKILNTRTAACRGTSPLFNRATQGLYAPGSTFKIVTAAAALDSGTFTPESRFNDPGYCIEYGDKVSNAGNPETGPEVFGNVNLVQAFEHSINAVFCEIGKKLGAESVLDKAKDFGFYSVPPLEVPADARSASGLYSGRPRRLFDPRNPNTQVDPGRLAFGQERMLVTPLQMAMVASGVANGGVVMKPHVMKEIKSANGKVVVRVRPQQYSKAMKPETAAALNSMMVQAVVSGTGTAAQIPGITVAGKTGTAETGVNRVYTAWFVFFAPAENPRVAGAVVLENQLDGFGGKVSAPIAKALMEAILQPTSNRKP
jgi:peptidoglycan glycosyltransferase